MGWKREATEFDGIEQFNFYRDEFLHPEDKVPICIQPFMAEITAFCDVGMELSSKIVADPASISLTRSTGDC